MLDIALTQPSDNRSLRCLGLVPQRIVHVTALLGFCVQSRCRAQVCLISEHNEKFSLLAVRDMLDHPRRDLTNGQRVVIRTAAAGVPRADRSHRSDAGCSDQEQTKDRSQSRRCRCAIWIRHDKYSSD